MLAAVGPYGVMSHLVSQGTHDIGVLVTLGARPRNIVGLVVRQGMALAGIGIVMGLVRCGWVDPGDGELAIRHEYDAVTVAAVPVLLIVVAFAATAIPALRATSVDPMVALREE